MFRFLKICALCSIFILPMASEGALSLSLDYLFWHPCNDGFLVTAKETGTPIVDGGFSKENVKKTLKLMDHENNSGFRLGGSLCLPYTESELMVNWTYYSPNDTKKMKEKIPNIISITGIPFGGKSSIGKDNENQEVTGSWDLDLNTIDACLSQDWNWIPLIDLKPYVGLKVASIEQELKMSADATFTQNENVVGGILNSSLQADIESKSSLQHDFKGVGPTVGIETRITLLCGIGIYGSASGSLLYGDQEVRDRRSIEQLSGTPIGDALIDEPLDVEFHKSNERTCMRMATSLQAGLFWHMTLFSGCPFIDVKLGWEQQQFFNQNFADFGMGSNDDHLSYENDDLNLQGITLSMSLNF